MAQSDQLEFIGMMAVSGIDKTLHACTSECDFKGIRYTVLIGSAEKYLYRIDDQWYVESIHPEVDTG